MFLPLQDFQIARDACPVGVLFQTKQFFRAHVKDVGIQGQGTPLKGEIHQNAAWGMWGSSLFASKDDCGFWR